MSNESTPAVDSSSVNSAASTSTHHPAGFWFFFWGEFAERFSFYGMRVLLPLFMTARLGMTEQHAGSIMNGFKFGIYFLPLVGGFIADRFLGKYWTIISFSIPYVLGHFILGIEKEWALFLGLALLAGGSGVIKPNVSTLMGLTYDQKRPGNERLRAAAFMWFYFSVNIGAFISQLISPIVRGSQENPNYGLAFQIPAWMMVVALGVFALGKPFYAVEQRSHRRMTFSELVEQLIELRPLFTIFLFIIFFWVVYEQNDVQWIFFVREHVNLPTVNLPWLGLENKQLQADQFQALNPFLVVTFVPTFNILFKYFDPDVRIFTAMRKMLVGFCFIAVGVGLMAAAGQLAAATESKVSLAWYLIAFSFLTLGEILIYGTGLEMSYAYAPARMKSFVTACFLLTAALASFINSGLSHLYTSSLHLDFAQERKLPPGMFFGLMTLLMVFTTIAFYFVGKRFDRHTRAKAAA